MIVDYRRLYAKEGGLSLFRYGMELARVGLRGVFPLKGRLPCRLSGWIVVTLPDRESWWIREGRGS